MATSCVLATASADVCANCGQEGDDVVKLKNCTACLLVKYCSVDCQKTHRKLHKKACKKRSAELKDERLYSQGHERQEADFCPICTLPMQFPLEKNSSFNPCCMKRLCNGCMFAAMKRNMSDCPFCREHYCLKGDAEILEKIQARVVKKDPDAIMFLGEQIESGMLGLERNMSRAVALWTEAAELGSADACFHLGLCYTNGDGVAQNFARGVSFYEKAAMLGQTIARHSLGCFDGQIGNNDRAVRHLLISAKMGYTPSLETFKLMFKNGFAKKSHYAEALKGYQDALEEMKSPERDEAKTFFDPRL